MHHLRWCGTRNIYILHLPPLRGRCSSLELWLIQVDNSSSSSYCSTAVLPGIVSRHVLEPATTCSGSLMTMSSFCLSELFSHSLEQTRDLLWVRHHRSTSGDCAMLTPKSYFFNFLSCRVYAYNYHESTNTHMHTLSWVELSWAEPRTEYTTKPSTNERIPLNMSPGHSWRNTLRTVHFSLFYSSLTVKNDSHLSYIDPPYVIIGSYPTDTTPIMLPLTF